MVGVVGRSIAPAVDMSVMAMAPVTVAMPSVTMRVARAVGRCRRRIKRTETGQ